MHAPFLLDDTAFLLDGAVVEVEFAGQVTKHQQNGVQQFGACGGHIGNLEPRVVKPRRRVDVTAVGHTIVLQDVHHIDVGEIAGALEGDMLDKVGQAALAVLLDQ